MKTNLLISRICSVRNIFCKVLALSVPRSALRVPRSAFCLICGAAVGAQIHRKHDFEIKKPVVLVFITALAVLNADWRRSCLITAVLQQGGDRR